MHYCLDLNESSKLIEKLKLNISNDLSDDKKEKQLITISQIVMYIKSCHEEEKKSYNSKDKMYRELMASAKLLSKDTSRKGIINEDMLRDVGSRNRDLQMQYWY